MDSNEAAQTPSTRKTCKRGNPAHVLCRLGYDDKRAHGVEPNIPVTDPIVIWYGRCCVIKFLHHRTSLRAALLVDYSFSGLHLSTVCA